MTDRYQCRRWRFPNQSTPYLQPSSNQSSLLVHRRLESWNGLPRNDLVFLDVPGVQDIRPVVHPVVNHLEQQPPDSPQQQPSNFLCYLRAPTRPVTILAFDAHDGTLPFSINFELERLESRFQDESSPRYRRNLAATQALSLCYTFLPMMSGLTCLRAIDAQYCALLRTIEGRAV